MLIKRVLTAAIAAPLLIAVVLWGKPAFSALATVAIIILAFEYAKIARATGNAPIMGVLILFAGALPAVNLRGGLNAVLIWLFIMSWALVAVKLGSRGKISLERMGATAFGVIYIGLSLTLLANVYNFKSGTVLLLFIFAGTWLADTSAYAVGRLFGRTPLAPRVSPNKTWEGAVGSISITTVVFTFMIFMPELNSVERLIFGLCMALAAGAGDLFESALKREAGVKDSGALLPGHGGLLDRLDSLIMTGPVGYLLFKAWVG